MGDMKTILRILEIFAPESSQRWSKMTGNVIEKVKETVVENRSASTGTVAQIQENLKNVSHESIKYVFNDIKGIKSPFVL